MYQGGSYKRVLREQFKSYTSQYFKRPVQYDDDISLSTLRYFQAIGKEGRDYALNF